MVIVPPVACGRTGALQTFNTSRRSTSNRSMLAPTVRAVDTVDVNANAGLEVECSLPDPADNAANVVAGAGGRGGTMYTLDE
jgi:hypothetical protein